MRVLVLADTHLRAGRSLPHPVNERLEWADVVLHAGDVVEAEVLERLARSATVHAVLGNNDHQLSGVLPETRDLEIGGVAVGLIHDSGPRQGRERRLRRRFPEAALVVFGHSHVPVLGPGEGGQVLLNPGSPTQRRRQPRPTFAELVVAGGRIEEARIVEVGGPGPGPPQKV